MPTALSVGAKGNNVKRPLQKCPDFNGLCVYEECPAFKAAAPSLWQCKTCNEIHQTGGTCTDSSHYRAPVYIKDFYKCVKYGYTWCSTK